jgi:hypothetical protein
VQSNVNRSSKDQKELGLVAGIKGISMPIGLGVVDSRALSTHGPLPDFNANRFSAKGFSAKGFSAKGFSRAIAQEQC